MVTPKHSVSVAGVVLDDNQRVLLICRRDNGHWEPPGGVLELDETPQAGVVREVFEETGIKATVVRLSGVYKNMNSAIVALVFTCRLSAGIERESSEASQVEWVTLDVARKRMAPAYFVRVADAFDSQTHVRSHDGVELLA